MLQRMRDSAEGLMGKIIAVAIILVMSLFGFGAFSFFAVGDPAVAEIGSREIGENQLRIEIERARQFEIARMGADYDPAAIDEDRLRSSTMDRLVQRALRMNEADSVDLMFPDKLVDARIVADPSFQSASGGFDTDGYRLAISRFGYTPTSFREEYRNQLTEQTLVNGLLTSSFMTDRELRRIAEVLDQSRDLAWLVVSAENFEDEVNLTDDELAAYHEANPGRFVDPERADIEYVSMAVSDFEYQVEVTDAQIEQAWQREAAAFESAERRQSRHILLATDERTNEEALALAAELRQRLVDGEDFAALAEEFSDDPGSRIRGGDLGYSARGTFVPPFEDALFALEVDAISQPVESQFGVHIIQLTGIESSEPPTLDERRAALREDIAREQAQQLFAEQVAPFEDEVYESVGLGSAAERFGLEVLTVNGITRDAGIGIAANPRVRNAAFEPRVLDQSRNSDVVRVGDDQVVAIRVAKHYPERQKALDDVIDEVRTALLAERTAQLAEAAAQGAVEKLKTETSSSLVADDVGGTWTTRGAITRRTAIGIPQPVVRMAFSLEKPAAEARSVGMTDLGNGNFAVVTVTNVKPGDWAALPEADQTTLRQVLQNGRAGAELQAVMDSLRERYEVSVSGM